MAVRRQPKPSATRSQIDVLMALAGLGTFGLALLTTLSSGGASLKPSAALPATATLPAVVAPVPTDAPQPVVAPVATPRPTDFPPGPYIGIVAGHWGNDSGSVCADGVTEAGVNFEIAKRVYEILRARGYWVDLMQEFDPRLNGYRADVLVSIHADSCQPIDADPPATGFKVARSAASAIPTTEDKLVNCIISEYEKSTALPFHANSITRDMTSYHSFSEVDPDTPAAIIETGFLFLDYNLLVKHPERPAEGIANGITCFLNSQP